VLNRIGKMLKDFKISSKNSGVKEMKFHESGLLAIRGSHSVSIVQDFSESLEITMDKGTPNILAWSKDGNYLAIGTNQGSLVIFDFMSEKKLFLSGWLPAFINLKENTQKRLLVFLGQSTTS
jgi:WD40 repeat protein